MTALARAATTIVPAPKSKSAVVRAAENFLELLILADGAAIAVPMVHDAWIDQPLWGRARGRGELYLMVARAGGWLGERRAKVQHLTTIVAGGRAVAEQTLHLVIDAKAIELPIAVVAEGGANGLSSIRTYHSTWPLTKTHAVRSPLLARDSGLVPSDAVGAYQRALAEGDLEAVLAAYENDASVREPNGGQLVFRGKARLREIYGLMFGSGGGIALEYATMTDDMVRCAIEYNCSRWGRVAIPAQAGIAVYERGPAGLAAARIYDDVDPPLAND